MVDEHLARRAFERLAEGHAGAELRDERARLTRNRGLPLLRPCPMPQYWRDRADEVRASGEAMHDHVARQTLPKMAEEYETLAERAARRAQE